MPVDSRSLLRAASAAASSSALSSQEGIKDRFASYHPTTKLLRCLACQYVVVKHESLWASHTASKSHRSNVAQIRIQEEENRERDRQGESKANGQEKATEASGSKRKGIDDEMGVEMNSDAAKRFRNDTRIGEVDTEWEKFQREVLNAPSALRPPPLSTYADATIEVAPELRRGNVNADVDVDADGEEGDEVDEVVVKKRETEVERKTRLEQEEREEILSRFEEEQRVQDEADERVTALRNRLERIKQARSARKG
ncbi:hypothetical protein CBS101457_003367 [Exobasidium rhododendri]|nr:hypothetical protein CBS101457_003367 [Exobasidium rhododendri]